MDTVKAIVFDLDGTLIHSAPDMRVSLNRSLEKLGRPPLDLATVISFIGNGVEVLLMRSLKATGGASPAEHEKAVALFLADYEIQKTILTRPYDGVVGCLERLQAQGVAMAVCTNKPQAPAREMCAALDLERFFDDITGAQAGAPKKPDPAPLLSTLKRLGVAPEESIYIGDSAVDFETARNAQVAFRLFGGGYLNAALPDLDPANRFDDWSAIDLSL